MMVEDRTSSRRSSIKMVTSVFIFKETICLFSSKKESEPSIFFAFGLSYLWFFFIIENIIGTILNS